mmetsp:Transcript_107084/g.302720  ORF Transcript_107084/g.302720 Transcript_107084/m.302720 type:complete len:593 (-) Transcript_107084:186-1964(-)
MAASVEFEGVLSRVREGLGLISADINRLAEKHQQQVDDLAHQIDYLRSRSVSSLPNTLEAQLEPPGRDSPIRGVTVNVQGNMQTLEEDDDDSESIASVTEQAEGGWASEKGTRLYTTAKHIYRDMVRARMQNTLANNDHVKNETERLEDIHMRAVLPSAAGMKERVRDTISKPEYNVAGFYHDTGFCQSVARSPWFESLSLAVIAVNAVWAWVDVDYNHAAFLSEAHPVFQVAEHLFCAFFSVEWAIRFTAFRKKRDCLRDAWFVFDSVLAFAFAFDTWVITLGAAVIGAKPKGVMGNASILRLFRLMRLNRLGRLVRILKAMPEMLIVVRGIGVAVRSVFFTLVLLTVIIYVFGIGFRSISAGTWLEEAYFPSVPEAMLSLLLGGILAEYEDTVREIGSASVVVGLVFGFFMFVATITLMNFLIGVLVEAVRSVSATEKEQMTVKYVRANLLDFLNTSGIDEDKNQMLSRKEFETMLLNPKTAFTLVNMGVDVVGLVEFSDVLFQDGNELPFTDFIRLVLQLRGANPTTVKDLVDLRKFFMQEMKDLESNLVKVFCEQAAGSVSPKLTIPTPTLYTRNESRRTTLDKVLVN